MYKVEGFDAMYHEGALRGEEYKFSPCGTYSQYSVGLVDNPFGDIITDNLTDIVLTVATQTKKPKASQVKALVKSKVESFKLREYRDPVKGDMEIITSEATDEVLANTYPDDPKKVNVVFSGKYVYIDATNKQAEEVLSFLREIVGSLPAVALPTEKVSERLKSYIINKLPEPFSLGNRVKLVDELGLVNVISGGSIYSSEVLPTLSSGGRIKELGLEFDSVMSFVVKETFEISGIKFDKAFLSETEDDASGSFTLQYREAIRMFNLLMEDITDES